MPGKNWDGSLYVVGVDPGGTTGHAIIQVPWDSMFSDAPGEIYSFTTGHTTGSETGQVLTLADIVTKVNLYESPSNVVVICEDFDVMPQNPTTDGRVLLSPVRIAAMLTFAFNLSYFGSARLILQGRTIAKTTATDARLKAWDLYSTNDHERDATRHAITFIRRAKDDPELRRRAWQ